MISVSHLTKHYGDRAAVQGISFEVQKGEILGFLGPNGAGKTTTMRILTGFLPPSSGTAVVAGYDVFAAPLEVKKRVGYMPESPPVYHEMVVASYLDYVARIKGVPRGQRRSAVDSVVQKCNLTQVVHRRVGNLSRGYKQRVGLAQALIHDPEVLVLDEPTSGLDPQQIHEIRELIKGLGGRHTIILSTHILPEVTMICQRVVIISDGRLVAAESLDALATRARAAERCILKLGAPAGDALDVLRAVPGVTAVAPGGEGEFIVDMEPGRHSEEGLARAAVTRGWGLRELRSLAPSLEEIYLTLLSREKNP